MSDTYTGRYFNIGGLTFLLCVFAVWFGWLWAHRIEPPAYAPYHSIVSASQVFPSASLLRITDGVLRVEPSVSITNEPPYYFCDGSQAKCLDLKSIELLIQRHGKPRRTR